MARAKDAVGRGEDVAVRLPGAARAGVLDRNWRCADGELDVVAVDGDALVVCEVKTRSGTGFGEPAEAVDRAQGGPDPAGRRSAGWPRTASRWCGSASTWSRCSRRRDAGPARAAPTRGVLMALARTWSVGAARGRRAAGRDRGRPRRTGCRRAPGRPAGRGAAGVAGPGPGGGRQLRADLAEPADDPGAARRRRCPSAAVGFDLALACRRARGGRGGAGRSALDGVVLLGELGAGRAAAAGPRRAARPARGAPAPGMRRVVVPAATLAEAALVAGLRRARRGDAGRRCWLPARRRRPGAGRGRSAAGPAGAAAARTCADVVGQATPGGRSRSPRPAGTTCCWSGRPAPGKTMLAERLPGVLPPLATRTALEVTAVHSVAGLLAGGRAAGAPPAVRGAAPLGVGRGAGRRRVAGWPGRARSRWRTAACCSWTRRRSSRPACWTRCAHRWRAARSARPGRRGRALPGPVPAGARGQPVPVRARPARRDCVCTSMVRRRYLGRLSGPLLDRVDLQVQL